MNRQTPHLVIVALYVHTHHNTDMHTCGPLATELVQISKRLTTVTEETTETTFLFRQLSVALQKGNAVAFLSTFDTE